MPSTGGWAPGSSAACAATGELAAPARDPLQVLEGCELDLDTALKVELEEYEKVAHSQDAMAGMEAFFAKKSPVFAGK